jgi:cytochrome c peroxidase
VRYATRYRIFRSTTNDTATAIEVGSTAANYFFDASATAAQVYYYWVRAESGVDFGSFSASDQGQRATGQIVSGVFSPLVPSPIPTGNETTAAKAYLGKVLFWDEQLSSTDTVACGTCHRPAAGGSDPRTVVGNSRSRNPGLDNIFNTADDVFGSPGVIRNNADGTYTSDPIFGLREQVTPRHSPTYINAGYGRGGSFWDGRADEVFRDPQSNSILLDSFAILESQSVVPPLSAAEMAHGGRTWTQAAQKMAGVKPLALAVNIPPALQTWIGGRTYPQLFQEVYGTPDVTPARIAMAIAAHERSIFSDQAPLDKWAYGIESLTPQEETGRQLFESLTCSSCHGGPLLSDQSFHNIGVRPPNEDLGRGGITGRAGDNGRFKTPTLRNVELRAPYMHNGRFATLEDVVEFYNRGGDFDAPNINHDVIHPLNLTPQQKADLVAFLKRPLTDDRVRNETPPFDRPKLFTESTRVPAISGSGRAGAGSFVPVPIAIEPPLVGNPSFTVGVSDALGGASAVLVIDSSDPGVGGSIPAAGGFARVELNLSGSGNGNGYGSASLQIPDTAALVGQTFYGRWYVVDPAAANGFSVSRLFSFTVFGDAMATRRTPFDFDGDQKSDIAIFRPNANAEWWMVNSSNNSVFAAAFGLSSDAPVPADYTGDGKTDIAFYRPSTGMWFVLRSEDFSFYGFPFGNSIDVPAPADYDADGKADPAVFRSGAWYILRSTDGDVASLSFGVAGDKPVPADYDGDGKADVGIYRPNGGTCGEWWIMRSNAGLLAASFGFSTDKTVVGDWTGDGKADCAFFRPSNNTWYVLRSEDLSFFGFPFGVATDTPAPGDYDGDGKFDAAVFRQPGAQWFINKSSGGATSLVFGAPGDQPVPGAYVR